MCGSAVRLGLILSSATTFYFGCVWLLQSSSICNRVEFRVLETKLKILVGGLFLFDGSVFFASWNCS